MEQVTAWHDGLVKQGRVKAGQALGRRGALVYGANGHGVMDGPFVESQEAVGGYLILRVASLAEATAIARSSPTLPHGITIEVRPLLDECPVFARARQRLNEARFEPALSPSTPRFHER
jgi:hypothetical protein